MDQAQALRKLVMETGVRRARVVAISSGKGGVGKSNIAVNLAIRLSGMGRSVVLLDADLGTADADVLCGLQPVSTLAHVVAGRKTIVQAAIDAPGGFRLVPGASGLAQMAALSEFERGRLIQLVGELEATADVILVDTGAGVSPNVLGFFLAADEQVVVTTPEPTAMADAYALIKTANRQSQDLDIRVLVNLVRDPAEGRAVYDRLDAVCRRFLNLHVRYAGHVSLDPRVTLAVRRRRPFVLEYPTCDASACIGQLAHRLDRHAAEPRGEGLLRRMVLWLAG
jgi:flagellar biosynthesis protein FlhG